MERQNTECQTSQTRDYFNSEFLGQKRSGIYMPLRWKHYDSKTSQNANTDSVVQNMT